MADYSKLFTMADYSKLFTMTTIANNNSAHMQNSAIFTDKNCDFCLM